MNSIAHQQATKEAVSAKFRGGKRLICKTPPIYPQGAEREFQRVVNAYMKIDPPEKARSFLSALFPFLLFEVRDQHRVPHASGI